MKDTATPQLRPLVGSPRGKLLSVTLGSNAFSADQSTSIAVLKSDVLLLQKRIDALSADRVPFSSQMQSQEHLLLALPVEGNGPGSKQALLEAVLQKTSELSQALMTMTSDDSASPASLRTPKRASFVEQFVTLADRVASGAFDDYRSELAKTSLKGKKEEANAESVRAEKEKEAAVQAKHAAELQEQAMTNESQKAVMAAEIEGLKSQLAAFSDKGGKDGAAAQLATAHKELQESNRKLQEEHDRLRGLVEAFNKTSELGIRMAFQGITTTKFIQMCGLDVDVPQLEDVTHELPPDDAPKEPTTTKDKGGKGGDDAAAKTRVQIEALTMNLNKQNKVLQDVQAQMPALVQAKDERIGLLEGELHKVKQQLEILLEDQKQLKTVRAVQGQKQLTVSARPPIMGRDSATPDADAEVESVGSVIVQVRDPPTSPRKLKKEATRNKNLVPGAGDDEEPVNRELWEAQCKIAELQATVEEMNAERVTQEKKIRVADRTVMKAESLLAKKTIELEEMQKKAVAMETSQKLAQGERAIIMQQYRTLEGLVRKHQKAVETSSGKNEVLTMQLSDLEKDRARELELISTKYEEHSKKLGDRLKELNDPKALEVGRMLRSSNILDPMKPPVSPPKAKGVSPQSPRRSHRTY